MKTELFDVIHNCPADHETVQYVEDCKLAAIEKLSEEALDIYIDGLLHSLGLRQPRNTK